MTHVWKTTGHCLSKQTGEIILFFFHFQVLADSSETIF